MADTIIIRTDWTSEEYIQAEDYNQIRYNFALFLDSPYGEQSDADCSTVPLINDFLYLRQWFQQIVIDYNILYPTQDLLQMIELEGFDPDIFPIDNQFPALVTAYNYIGRSTRSPDAAELNLYGRLCEYLLKTRNLITEDDVTLVSESGEMIVLEQRGE